MLCCRGGSKEDENTTLVALSSGDNRDSVRSKSSKNGQQQQQQQHHSLQRQKTQPTADGRRSSGDGDSDDHFPPYGSSSGNVHFNVGFQQQQQQQLRPEEVVLEDASTWRQPTTSTFFSEEKDVTSSEAQSATLRRAHPSRPPSAFDVDVIEVRTSNVDGVATIPTSSGATIGSGVFREDDEDGGASGAAARRNVIEEEEEEDVNVVVAPPPPLPPPTAASEDDEVREEGEMKIRLLNDSSVSDASSFREDCPDLDVVDVVDPLRPVRTVEIVKNPGESLGFYIREGDGVGQENGVFISRMTPESPLEKSRLLNVGDEILTVNSINVSKMNLDDVVVIMSIPKRLVLLVRSRTRSATTDLPAYYLHHHFSQQQQHHPSRDGVGGAAVPSSTSFLSQQQQQQQQHPLRRRESQYRSHPTSATTIGSLHHRLPAHHPTPGGANSLPRGLPGSVAAEVAGGTPSSSSRYSAHILSAVYGGGEKSHLPFPPPPPHHQYPDQGLATAAATSAARFAERPSEAAGERLQDFPCDINAMKMSTLERKGKIERGNHLLKEHLKWDPCFERDEALGPRYEAILKIELLFANYVKLV